MSSTVVSFTDADGRKHWAAPDSPAVPVAEPKGKAARKPKPKDDEPAVEPKP